MVRKHTLYDVRPSTCGDLSVAECTILLKECLQCVQKECVFCWFRVQCSINMSVMASWLVCLLKSSISLVVLYLVLLSVTELGYWNLQVLLNCVCLLLTISVLFLLFYGFIVRLVWIYSCFLFLIICHDVWSRFCVRVCIHTHTIIHMHIYNYI